MKIVFVFERLSESKFFAPVIHEALGRGHQVELWLCHQDISQTTKWFEFPAIEKLPTFHESRPLAAVRTFITRDDLAVLSHNSDTRAVFAWLPPKHQKPEGQKWFHVVTSLFDSSTGVRPVELDRFDYIFFASPHWAWLTLEYFRITEQLQAGSELEESLKRKFEATGSPQLAHFPFCDRNSIRAKFGIPQDAKVVLLFAFECPAAFWPARIFMEPRLWKRLWSVLILPFSYPYIFSRIGRAKIFKLLWKSIWDRPVMLWEALWRRSQKDAVLAVREFCDRNGAFLVTKARRKRPLADYDLASADLVVDEDRDYFPFTTAQLITASDLVVACNSTAVVESVAGGRPVVNIAAPRPFYVRDHHLLLRMDNAEKHGLADEALAYNPDPGGMFHFKGVVWNFPVNKFVSIFRRASFQDFSLIPDKRDQYRAKYTGPLDEAAGIILERVEAIAGDDLRRKL